MSQTLYRKYRPQSWADVAGQQHIKVTLSFEVESGKIAHAYLFNGPRGVGKTTIARIMAKAINCLGKKSGGEACEKCDHCNLVNDGATLDIIEIDAASHRGIDNVRENVIENSRFSPAKLPFKVFIIDEVHMLTTEAFNALLKTLEEPPAHAIFILATTELHKVPATIISRCQRFDFRKIPFTDLIERLETVCGNEKCKVERRVLEEIARHSEGCLRDAEGLLGKVLTLGDGKRVSYDEALVVLPRSDMAAAAALVEALIRRDARTALLTIGDALEAGSDMEQFAGDAIELMRKTLLAKLAGNADMFTFDLDEERKKTLVAWADLSDVATLTRSLETLLEKRREMKGCHPVQLPLELAAVMICEKIQAVKENEKNNEPPSGHASTGGGSTNINVAPKTTAATTAGLKMDLEIEEKQLAETVELTAVDPATLGSAQYSKPRADRVAGATDGSSAEPLETAKASTEPVTTNDSLLSLWPEFIRRTGENNPSLQYILGTAEPAGVDGNIVKIGVGFQFHKRKLDDTKARLVLEQILGGILGAAIRIEGVLLDRKPGIVYADAVPMVSVPQAAGAPTDALAAAFGGKVVA